jgi:hypothetical protein
MVNENAQGEKPIMLNTPEIQDLSYLKRTSPLSTVSFFMFLLSWIYIGVGLLKGFVTWPHMPPSDSSVSLMKLINIAIVASYVIVAVSLFRLYVSFWKIERDPKIAKKLRAVNATFKSCFIPRLEWLLRLGALIVMYFLIGNLTNTDYYKIVGNKSQLCYLFSYAFGIFCLWDVVTKRRLYQNSEPHELIYFKLMTWIDMVSFFFSVSYSIAVYYNNHLYAALILMVFSGVLVVTVIIEACLGLKNLIPIFKNMSISGKESQNVA